MTRQVLLWGVADDPPLCAVRRELQARGIPHRLVDQRRLGTVGLELDAEPGGVTGRLRLAGERIDLRAFGALYARPVLARQREADDSELALERRLYAWANTCDALVVNRPSSAASNDSKPDQLEAIRRYGFAVPETLVTTSPDAARAFVARHGAVICKSVGRIRSVVSRVDETWLRRLDAVACFPTQFHAWNDGVDWRVHVVGDAVFACEIRCSADDYRAAARHGVAVDVRAAALPPAVAARCRALSAGLGLHLAGIDLRRAPDGGWTCFEVNPSPAFTYYEAVSGQGLTAAVAGLLAGAPQRAAGGQGGQT